jgi:hypothetical protein
MLKRLIVFLILGMPLSLAAIEFMKDYLDYKLEKPLPNISNDLVYGGSSSEVTTQIDEYATIKANQPIHGSIFVTHDQINSVDQTSFRMGSKPLKAVFVQNTQISPDSTVVVSVYRFQLAGQAAGVHTMPPISVSVGGKTVQALPLVIAVY